MTIIPLKIIRRVAAEVLACAMQEIFPGVSLVSGKETDLGFYYDFILDKPIEREALMLLEERMRGLIKENVEIEMLEMMRQNAIEMFRHYQQLHKVDELENRSDNVVQIWKMGTFFDCCEPPYGTHTGLAQAFKLQKVQRKTVSLPYFEKNGEKVFEKLQVIRIHGTACENKAELKSLIKKIDAYQENNHQAVGSQMGLYILEDELFAGGISWLPKGKFLRDQLLEYLNVSEKKLGFQSVVTPNVVKSGFFSLFIHPVIFLIKIQ